MSGGKGIHVAAAKEKSAPATIEQIAAMQFKAVKEFRDLPKDERQQRAYDWMNSIMTCVSVAAECVSLDKDELVELVESQYDNFGPMLMELAQAKDRLDAIREVVGSAEVRLAVVLAIIEGDDGGGGGEEAEAVA